MDKSTTYRWEDEPSVAQLLSNRLWPRGMLTIDLLIKRWWWQCRYQVTSLTVYRVKVLVSCRISPVSVPASARIMYLEDEEEANSPSLASTCCLYVERTLMGTLLYVCAFCRTLLMHIPTVFGLGDDASLTELLALRLNNNKDSFVGYVHTL